MGVLTRLLLTISILFLSSPGAGLAQGTPDSLSITISTPKAVVKAGEEVKVAVVLKNISNREILFPNYSPQGGEFNYTIDVRNDSKKTTPAETDYSRALHGKPNASHLAIMITAGPMFVKPGGTLTDSIDLRKLYDLSQPGKYTIQMQRTDDVSKNIVKSNTIALHVIP